MKRHHGRDIDGACGQLAVKVVAGAGAKANGGGDGCGGKGGEGRGGGGGGGGDIEDLVAGGKANGGRSRAMSGSAAGGGRKGARRKRGASSAGIGDTIEITEEEDVGRRNGSPRKKGGWDGRRWVAAALVLGVGVVAVAAMVRGSRRGRR